MTKTRVVLLVIFLGMLFFMFDLKCNKAHAQKCSIYGDKALQKFRTLDSLKNRNEVADTIDESVTLEKILTFKGDDTKKYNSSQYVELEGYVILVKAGGAETCNCHSKDPNDLDIHIEIALNPKAKNTDAMICEINRYTQSDVPEFTLSNIKKLLGKKVSIQGYLFFDEEHKQSAMTTAPKGKHNFRYTCWEVHPVMSINTILNVALECGGLLPGHPETGYYNTGYK